MTERMLLKLYRIRKVYYNVKVYNCSTSRGGRIGHEEIRKEDRKKGRE